MSANASAGWKSWSAAYPATAARKVTAAVTTVLGNDELVATVYSATSRPSPTAPVGKCPIISVNAAASTSRNTVRGSRRRTSSATIPSTPATSAPQPGNQPIGLPTSAFSTIRCNARSTATISESTKYGRLTNTVAEYAER
jgi:hypothetical protein